MSTPKETQQDAVERCDALLAARLKRGGISTSRPEWYFECTATDPQPLPAGGWQVRVKTRRHWSDADVHFDAETGEVLFRCIDRLCDPPTERELDEAEALEIVKRLVPLPEGATLRMFSHEYFAPQRKVTRLEWEHVHQGRRVAGDFLWVQLHPETRRVVAFAKKWRTM